MSSPNDPFGNADPLVFEQSPDWPRKVRLLDEQLQRFERLSPSQQNSILYEKLRRLLAHAKQFSPFWAQRLRSWPPRGSVFADAFADVPILSRGDLQTRRQELVADFPARKKLRVETVSTSGSTGTPVHVEHIIALHNPLQYAIMLLTARWHDIDPEKPVGTLLGKAKDNDHVPLGIPFSWYGPTGVGFSRCTIDREHEDLYNICTQKKPPYLHCGVEPLVGMARFASKSGRRDFRPEIALTVGSTVTQEMRDIVKSTLNAKIVDRYSTEETAIIAIQCPHHSHFHVLTSANYVEIVDDNNRPCAAGEPGRVLVTNLNSFSMPLIRYDIGDIAEWGRESDCGIRLPVIEKLLGRTSHTFLNPDGRKTYAKIYARDFDDLPELIEYRFVLHQKKVVDAQLRAREQSTGMANSVTKKVQRALNYPYEVKVRFVENIDWGLSWKKENFHVSDAPPP